MEVFGFWVQHYEGSQEGMIDLIMVSVRETTCRSDEDPDGKGWMSVSVRKHQGSEMVSKRLCQVVCRHVSVWI